MARKTPLEKLQKKYGVSSKNSGNSTDRLRNTVSNYKTRFDSAGLEDPTDKRNAFEKWANLEEDQNVLFDIFEILDRPRNALFTAIDEAASGGGFLEGLKEGITGEEKTSGKDLLLNHTNLDDEEGKLNTVDVLGFGLDIIGDPTNWALFGGKTAVDLGIDLAKKGAKSAANLSDDAVKTGLKALDTAQSNKVARLAMDKGFKNTDDFLRSIDINPNTVGNKLKGYEKLKTGLTDIFNQKNTVLGKLKASKTAAKGSNQLMEEAITEYVKPLENLSYDYVLRNSNNLGQYADDLAKLNQYTTKKGNTIAKWIKENPNSELAKVLQSEQNVVAEDILNMIQSGKSTNITGRKAIQELINTGNFTGSEESVNQLVDLLNRTSERAGLNLGEIAPRLASKVNENELAELTASLSNPSLTNAERKAIQDNIDTILRQNSSLTVGDRNVLKQFRNNPQFNTELNNLDLNYNLEYSADEWNRLQDLRQNEDFMNLVSQNEGAYKQVADRIKNITGLDYGDIVNRQGYVRKAQGTVADIENRIGDIDELLLDETLTPKNRELLQNTRDALNEELLSGSGSSVTARFGTQQYRQPAVVANRQYRESLEQQMKSIDTQIDNLKQGLSREKTDTLVGQLGALEEARKSSLKLERLNEKLAKQNTSLAKIDEKIISTNNNLKITSDKITDNIISKSKKIQDQSVTNKFAKELTDVNNLKKQANKLTKQLTKAGGADDATIKGIVDNLDNVNRQLDEATLQLRKTTAVIDGHVDDTITKSLNNNAKNITKYVEQSKQLDKLTASKNTVSESILNIQENINSITRDLDKAIANTNFKLENINTLKDIDIEEQIKALSKAKSILESEAGETLFNLNFYAGLDDFVKNVGYTNQTAKVFSDAITMGVFRDENVIKTAANIGDEIPKGWTKISGTNLSNRLNAVQNIISEGNPSDALKALMKSLKGNTYYMDERMAALFGTVTAPKQNTNALLNLVDKFNTTFKKFSTLTPGFQLRNYAGNSFNMYLSGMPVGQIVPYQAKATKLLNSSEDLIRKMSTKGFDALTDVEKSNWQLLQQFFEGGFNKAGTAARDLEKVQQSIQLGSKINPVNTLSNFNMKLNESADAMNRMALLMYANDDLAKGGKYLQRLGAENPIQAVKYALMDPSNMSEVEQSVIKKIIPFYTFTKQNLMFQATNMLKNTVKYKNALKALNNAYNDLDEDSYYQYQKDAMQLPIPSEMFGIPIPGASDDDGNQLFLKTNLPLSDLGEFMSDPLGRFASSLTPIIKAPIEYKTGKSLFTGDDTTYNNLSKALTSMGVNNQGVLNSADAAELILNNFGLQNVSVNLVKKVQAILDNYNGDKSGKQLWGEIFRSVLQNTNQENVELNNLYDDLEIYQAEINRLKKQGIDVPTIREINASNNLKLNNLKKKRASSK